MWKLAYSYNEIKALILAGKQVWIYFPDEEPTAEGVYDFVCNFGYYNNVYFIALASGNNYFVASDPDADLVRDDGGGGGDNANVL